MEFDEGPDGHSCYPQEYRNDEPHPQFIASSHRWSIFHTAFPLPFRQDACPHRSTARLGYPSGPVKTAQCSALQRRRSAVTNHGSRRCPYCKRSSEGKSSLDRLQTAGHQIGVAHVNPARISNRFSWSMRAPRRPRSNDSSSLTRQIAPRSPENVEPTLKSFS